MIASAGSRIPSSVVRRRKTSKASVEEVCILNFSRVNLLYDERYAIRHECHARAIAALNVFFI